MYRPSKFRKHSSFPLFSFCLNLFNYNLFFFHVLLRDSFPGSHESNDWLASFVLLVCVWMIQWLSMVLGATWFNSVLFQEPSRIFLWSNGFSKREKKRIRKFPFLLRNFLLQTIFEFSSETKLETTTKITSRQINLELEVIQVRFRKWFKGNQRRILERWPLKPRNLWTFSSFFFSFWNENH